MKTVTTLDLTLLEDLDWSYKVPCDHVIHAKGGVRPPAAMIVGNHPCPKCSAAGADFFLCSPCWALAFAVGLYCPACDHLMSRDEGWFIRRMLK